MTEEYEEFVRENRGHAETLGNGLVALERDPDDGELVDELFRAAHSLKGNCDMAGLGPARDVAHAIEDVLTEIRAGRMEPERDIVSTTLDAAEDLNAMLTEARETGAISIDSDRHTTALRALIGEREPGGAGGEADATADAGAESTADDPFDLSFGGSPDGSASAEEALENVSALDDLDALVDAMDDEADEFAELEGGGSFASLRGDPPDEAVAGDPPADDAAPGDLVDAGASVDDTSDPVGGGGDDQTAPAGGGADVTNDGWEQFQELQDEGDDPDDFDELTRAIEDAEFGEFDDEDDVSIQELIEATEPPDSASDDGTAADSLDDAGAEPAGSFADPDDGAADTFGGFDDAEADPLADVGGTEDDPLSGIDEAEADPDSAVGDAPADPPDATGGVSDEMAAGADETADALDDAGDGSSDEPADAGFVWQDEDDADDPVADDPSPDAEPDLGSDTVPAADVGGDPTPADDPADGLGAGSSAPEDPSPGGVSLEGARAEGDVDLGDADPGPAGAGGIDAGTEDLEAAMATDEDFDVGSFQGDSDTAAFESRFREVLGTGRDEGPETRVHRLIDRRALGLETGDDEPDASAGIEGETDRIESLSIDVSNADVLLNAVEHLSITRARLGSIAEELPPGTLSDPLAEFDEILDDLRATVMDIRLMPLSTVTDRLPRVARRVADREDKEVEMNVTGSAITLDRGIIDGLSDPIVHLVRNAVGHGIEPAEERAANDKPRTGTIDLRASRVGGHVEIELQDDGRGIDPDAIREQVVANTHLTAEEARRLDDATLYDQLFEAGFSTASEVTNTSGRGVGMNVVKQFVDEHNGSIEVESDPGLGTLFRLSLPVSTAVMEVLFVEVGDERYGIPGDAVDRIEPFAGAREVDGQEIAVTAEESAVADGGERAEGADRRPLIRLSEAFDTPGGANEDGGVVVYASDAGRSVAVLCDDAADLREVVVHPYGDELSRIGGVNAATVQGDEIVSIIDIASL